MDVDFTFFLIEDKIGELHEELAQNYQSIILSRAREAIKNDAASISFTQYFQDRKLVERRFSEAVANRWNETPPLNCVLDQFHIGRIQIPTEVARKQLESRIQNERNEKESSLQKATIERQQTEVIVNKVRLDKEKLLRTSNAEANLLRANARAESERIVQEAQINGTKLLVEAAGITTEEEITAFTYIRTLANRRNVDLSVSYLSSDNVLRTRPA